ncbi:MAG TPA: hypothetical protein VNO26_06590 [Candidatus Limnocylindria bacterium]|nr:hypothetical protein [Candidatus Limnocylindria bacterium]
MRRFALYTALFAVLSLPWFEVFDRALPASTFAFISDMRLIVWILSWVSHALASDPARLFDAPINHPAPGQLTGCEHFLSSQLAFAPVYWVTGNGVLAANWTVWLSYPLAAFAMDCLVRRLGGSPSAAFVAGVAFALGPLRVPANFQVLQYANLYLPVLYLALLALRDRPNAARTAELGVVLGLGVFSAYYMAVMLAVTGALAGLIELGRAGNGRVRFSVLALAAAALAALALALFSIPYFGRPESIAVLRDAVAAQGTATTLWWWLPYDWWTLFGGVSVLLALAGVSVALSADARRLAVPGMVFAIAGTVLALGSTATVGGRHIALPFALLERAGLVFFRAPIRFVVLAGFGTALLGAAGFDRMTRRLGVRARIAAAVLVTVALVLTRGAPLHGRRTATLEPHRDAASLFAAVRDTVRAHGDGPMLELPAFGRLDVHDSEAMLHATRHWITLVGGYTGYPAAHRSFLRSAVGRLPEPDALVDLVDATHLRWLLLAPERSWGSAEARRAFEAGLETTGMATRRWRDGGWSLWEVTRRPRRDRWFRAIARGYRPGFTVFGVPVRRLTGHEAVATVTARNPPAVRVTGWPFRLAIEVRNAGTAPWPVSVPQWASPAYVVDLVAVWKRRDGPPVDLPSADVPLPHDVEPGEIVRVTAVLPAPSTPGTYELVVRPRQRDGAAFDGAGNVPLRLSLTVTPPPGRHSSPRR